MELKTLADNIIGQHLVNNLEAIKQNILSFNESRSGYQVTWLQYQKDYAGTPYFHYKLDGFEIVYPGIVSRRNQQFF